MGNILIKSISALYLLWFYVHASHSFRQSAISHQPSRSPIAESRLLKAMSEPIGEKHRPQFHFTPPQKWMNDPNGMFYYKGEYHLFYQHFPDSTVWGPMHWGHAVSKDLMHWKHLPIALFPDKNGLIFSGSVVVDEKNTSGFGKKGETPIVAIFTNHSMEGEKAGRNDFQTQGIAYSVDKGRTWTKYDGNPVIKNPNARDFRDPKVMWYEPTREWVMTLAEGDHVSFYNSKNLKSWEKTGEFGKNQGSHGGVWECPDLFELSVESGALRDARNSPLSTLNAPLKKWVLLQSIGNGAPNGGSGTQYFVGSFDGKTFTNDNPSDKILWLDYGRDNYAGVTWNSAPDNKRLFLGWMSNWQYATSVPTVKWRSAMTLPRELDLKNTEYGLRLFQKPVKQIEKMRGEWSVLSGQITSDSPLTANHSPLTTEDLNLSFDLAKSTSEEFGIELSNSLGEKVLIGFDKKANSYFIDRTQIGKTGLTQGTDYEKYFAGKHPAPRSSKANTLKMNLYIDVASVELFADDGATVMTDIFFPNEDFNKIAIYSKGGSTFLNKSKMWSIK